MKQVFVGSILAAVVMFAGGFLYWTVFPLPYTILRSVPDEPALAAQLKQALPATGVYLLLNTKRHVAGPLAAPVLATYKARFKLAAVAGLAGAIYSNLGKPIWWHQPWDFHVLNFAFDFGSWVLAAFVLAWAIKPKA